MNNKNLLPLTLAAMLALALPSHSQQGPSENVGNQPQSGSGAREKASAAADADPLAKYTKSATNPNPIFGPPSPAEMEAHDKWAADQKKAADAASEAASYGPYGPVGGCADPYCSFDQNDPLNPLSPLYSGETDNALLAGDVKNPDGKTAGKDGQKPGDDVKAPASTPFMNLGNNGSPNVAMNTIGTNQGVLSDAGRMPGNAVPGQTTANGGGVNARGAVTRGGQVRGGVLPLQIVKVAVPTGDGTPGANGINGITTPVQAVQIIAGAFDRMIAAAKNNGGNTGAGGAPLGGGQNSLRANLMGANPIAQPSGTWKSLDMRKVNETVEAGVPNLLPLDKLGENATEHGGTSVQEIKR